MLKVFFIFSFVLSIFIAPVVTGAHSIWINMTDWNPSVGDENKAWTRMYIGWGHRFPVDGVTNKKTFDYINLVRPDNSKERIELEYEGISTSEITTTKNGAYILSLTRKPSIYNTYRENGLIKRGYGDRSKFPNVIESLRTQQFSTAHFRVGERVDNYIPKCAGNTLELVPLADPYAANKNYIGTTLPVQLLLDGSPVPYTPVTATYAGFSSTDAMAERLLTDKDGIAHVRIVHWGQWLLKAKAERPATGTLAKIADKEVYYTTLTFEI